MCLSHEDLAASMGHVCDSHSHVVMVQSKSISTADDVCIINISFVITQGFNQELTLHSDGRFGREAQSKKLSWDHKQFS